MQKAIYAALALFFLFGTAACDRDEGGAEEAGESLNEAADEMSNEVDDATNEQR